MNALADTNSGRRHASLAAANRSHVAALTQHLLLLLLLECDVMPR